MVRLSTKASAGLVSRNASFAPPPVSYSFQTPSLDICIAPPRLSQNLSIPKVAEKSGGFVGFKLLVVLRVLDPNNSRFFVGGGSLTLWTACVRQLSVGVHIWFSPPSATTFLEGNWENERGQAHESIVSPWIGLRLVW